MNKEELENRMREYTDAIRSMETDRWVGQYAEDGSVEDPVGLPAVVGQDQLRSFFDRVRENFSLLDLQPEFMIITPPEVVIKWSTRGVTRKDFTVNFQGISTFRFRNDGRIQQMRAFWDAKDVARQLKAAARG